MFAKRHNDDICPICFWQDELYQLVFPDGAGGANLDSLIVAQQNFAAFGACEAEMRERVRPPSGSDIRDAGWRPLETTRDQFLREAKDEDHARWRSVMERDPCLYYWRSDYWLLSHLMSSHRITKGAAEDGSSYRCPCCGYRTLGERGGNEICDVCFWEDEGEDGEHLDDPSGANGLTLREGRANFAEFGACERRFLQNVRPPTDEER
jgi:hypothetical protein